MRFRITLAGAVAAHQRLHRASGAKKGLPKPLERLQRVLTKGLLATEAAWDPLKQVYGWIHQLAQVLDQSEEMPVEERQLRFAVLLMHLQEQAAQLEPPWQ